MTSLTTPYDRDLYSWAAEQAELLRLRRFDQVDWPNVIEEIARSPLWHSGLVG